MTKLLTAQDIVRLLDLKPHPEGGHYRETWRADAALGERSDGTAIYYLLGEGEISHWHRIDADEIWHWHAGSASISVCRTTAAMSIPIASAPIWRKASARR